VAIDGSGNVITTGNSYIGDLDYFTGYSYTAKYAAANGALLWEKYWSFVHAMVLDASGNVVVTGVSSNPPPHGPVYTAKFAGADGALLWENGGGGDPAVAIDRNGNVFATGSSSNATNSGRYTTKYAAVNGAVIWETRSNPTTNAYSQVNALAIDGNGNVVVTGYTDANNSDYYTAKYASADGALLWEKRYNGPANGDDSATALAVDNSGNVVVTGSSYNGTNDDYYTAKYASVDGALLWERSYDSHGYDRPSAVAVDGNGNVVVTGSASDHYYTAKYAAVDGALLWAKRYNGPANDWDEPRAVAVDSSGNAVVTGFSYNNTNSDYYTAKYATANGALLWEQRYNGPANGNDWVSSRGLALGPNGMVAITGASFAECCTFYGSDYATVVYRENLPVVAIESVSTGVRIRFPGVPGHTYTIERALAVGGPWSSIATPTAPLNGIIEYTDTKPPMSGAFYRTSARAD
jgi:hypothetical protein